jgi:lipopolysaccharide transport system ATP-binding protein
VSGPAISVQDLRKRFRLGTSGAASIKTALLWWRRRNFQTLEVLNGISFEVQKGECVAIVGRNGAGKSTLLSILARVYKPTSGRFHVGGRLAPLLELGAGFHLDLTGAENVVFNGVILGLSRKEVRRRMDAIIEFAELAEHIHAPVRTYSSGMLARLGFAVAIHVDAEVLIVDEVLSVGDVAFEKKCLHRIDEFRKAGGTILLVSHNGGLIRRFADRCIWLDHGRIKMEGSPDEVIDAYEALARGPEEEPPAPLGA